MTELRCDVFTLFPELITSYCSATILGRAIDGGLIDLRVRDIRDGASDPHRSVDDAPFGGGAGMVLMPEPIFQLVEEVETKEGLVKPLIFLTPGGRRFTQEVAVELASLEDGFSMLCARYEGVDQRVIDQLVDDEISLGDFVLAGGELAALSVLESVARLIPGVLGNADSIGDESFSKGLLEYPQYTRPADFKGFRVPEVLRSGNHEAVARWRYGQSLARTLKYRPDLVKERGGLTCEEEDILKECEEVHEADYPR